MDSFEVIAMFLDGERVDPAALKDALASDEGRQYLVDVVALREMTADRAPAPPVTLTRTIPARVLWIRRAAAAAAAVMCVIGAYAAGHRSADAGNDPAAGVSPPVADRPDAASGRSLSAPSPTSVIRFQPGVDWTETSGGN
jgi:hypothetical protein